MLESLSAGSVCVNDTVIFMVSPELPFGGVGTSGMGRYRGWYGFETFSHMKPVMTRSFRLDAPLRYPPYTDTKARLFKSCVESRRPCEATVGTDSAELQTGEAAFAGL